MLIAERLWEILNRQIILLTALDAFIAEVGIFNGIINRGGLAGRDTSIALLVTEGLPSGGDGDCGLRTQRPSVLPIN